MDGSQTLTNALICREDHDMQVLTYGKDFSPLLLKAVAALLLLGRPRRSPSTPVLATLDRILVAKQADIDLLARLYLLQTCLSAESPSALLTIQRIQRAMLSCEMDCLAVMASHELS